MLNLISFIILASVSLIGGAILMGSLILMGRLLVKVIPAPHTKPIEVDRHYHVNVGKCRRYLKKRGIKVGHY